MFSDDRQVTLGQHPTLSESLIREPGMARDSRTSDTQSPAFLNDTELATGI